MEKECHHELENFIPKQPLNAYLTHGEQYFASLFNSFFAFNLFSMFAVRSGLNIKENQMIALQHNPIYVFSGGGPTE